ncbi:hypothetical protein GCM10015535_23310 [Streptomyces gelaticus]|uniref:Uncharacterized protein n=1 Tax=Streptomyces gelaticus TaxID=285446 RepID=A0ABQ2VX46_9ACTN|nr:hypothetical protein GCM10015535_23310 [Streptomyces gelaticus]
MSATIRVPPPPVVAPLPDSAATGSGGPKPWGAGVAGRVRAVHAVPSHHRSVPGAAASGYQPGAVALVVPPTPGFGHRPGPGD